MNKRRTNLLIFGGLFFGLFALGSILLGETNAIAHLFLYLTVTGGLLAVLAPRHGFYLLLVSCAYTDLLKRLMVVSGRMSMSDLFYVLGFSPVLLGVIISTLLLRGMVGKLQVTAFHMKLLVLAGLLFAATTAMAALGGEKGVGKLLQHAANGGFYASLLFVIPVLLPTVQQCLKLLRFVMWIYVPVALYGIAQGLWGFREFEVAYLRTGLSIEIKQLLTDRVRAFSTLNSPTALGAISACLMTLPLFLARTKNRMGRRFLPLSVAALLTVLYAGSLVASTSRSGLIVVAVICAGTVCFKSARGTLLFYLGASAAFAALVAAASVLRDRLAAITEYLLTHAGGLGEANLNVNTFSDRLQGFSQVLTNPSAYTLFGHGLERGKDPNDPLYNHDMLSGILVQYGAVALFGLLLTGAFLLWRVHAAALRLQIPALRRLCAYMLALLLGLVAISVTSGTVLSIFPVNTFFWLAASFAIVICRAEMNPAMSAAADVLRANAGQQTLVPAAVEGAGFRNDGSPA